MAGQPKRDTRYDHLMDEVCVGYGFCGSVRDGKPTDVNQHYPAEGPVTAEQFAEWVILAELGDEADKKFHDRGVEDILERREDPESYDEKWPTIFRDLFIAHMGAAVVDVSELQWSGKLFREQLEFRVDDLTGADVLSLVARHLRGMHEDSPPESVHAFDVSKLKQPGVTFWTAWFEGELAGMGALKRLDAERGEIKSMRVADAFLDRGIGRAMLEHIIREARGLELTSLWLETGSTPSFEPALKLYESAGFEFCGPFGDYKLDPFSRFMWREV